MKYIVQLFARDKTHALKLQIELAELNTEMLRYHPTTHHQGLFMRRTLEQIVQPLLADYDLVRVSRDEQHSGGSIPSGTSQEN